MCEWVVKTKHNIKKEWTGRKHSPNLLKASHIMYITLNKIERLIRMDEMFLPSQALVLQPCDSVALPGHICPPLETPSHVRLLSWLPPPQVTGHILHSDHIDQDPSTKQQVSLGSIRKKSMANISINVYLSSPVHYRAVSQCHSLGMFDHHLWLLHMSESLSDLLLRRLPDTCSRLTTLTMNHQLVNKKNIWWGYKHRILDTQSSYIT